MVDLSIIIPSIRVAGWKDLVNQISVAAGDYTFEVIFVGPEYNQDVDQFKNVKYVRDFGSPNRCQQIGLMMAEGKFVTWFVDDYESGPFNIDKFMDSVYNEEEEAVAIGNYDEAGVLAVHDFSIRHCYGGGSSIKPDWQIFNVAFVRRSYLERFGGFDCRYQVTCLGHTDLAARLQDAGCRVINNNINLGAVKHLPDTSGDHGPVHNAQVFYDQPLFNRLTNGSVNPKVQLDNWKKEAAVWPIRHSV
jgi:hypothetical protein